MDIIGFLNSISFIFILAAVAILLVKLFKTYPKDTSLILIIISFGILSLVNFTNLLEHLNITNYLDLFEDELEIVFIPLFIFAVFSYCLKKELQINDENKKRLQESHIR